MKSEMKEDFREMVVTGAGVCCSRTKCLSSVHFSLYVMTHKSCLNISGTIFLSLHVATFPSSILCSFVFFICNI